MKDTWKSPNFYSLDRKGKIRLYNVRADRSGEVALLVSSSGLLDGIQTEHSKWVNKGKNIGKSNETTPFGQAREEARSKCRERLDEGYKTFARLIQKVNELEIGYISLGAKETLDAVRKLFTRLNIKYNTNKNWDELPMLAQPLKKVKNLQWPYIEQPKLNGVRCKAKLKDGKVVLMSRGGKYYYHEHIELELRAIFEKHPDIILDGELYKHRVPLQEITACVKTENRDAFFDDSWLEYHVYDLWLPIALELEQTDRERLLTDIVLNSAMVHKNTSLHFVESMMVYNMEEAMIYHNEWVEDGYEGAILRSPDAVYEPGFRTNSLIKIKEFEEEEFEIIGCKVDEGKGIGKSFVWELRNDINTEHFYARPRGTEAMKEHWFNHQLASRGKMVTVRFQERTKDGIPHQGHVTTIRDYE